MPPAARASDNHLCPLVTVLVPHVGGPILPPCCPTVMIGMMPAARVTDMLTCVGPPDVIAKGSPTVLIGNLMAARLLDLTVHGGVIMAPGCPTVMIGEAGGGGGGGGGGGAAPGGPAAGAAAGAGGAAAAGGAAGSQVIGQMNGLPIVKLKDGSIRIGKNLIIKGSPAFQAKVLADLGKIANTKTGASMLDAIENNKLNHTVTLKELDLATAQKKGAKAKKLDVPGSADPKKGSDTEIAYNPDVKLQFKDQDGDPIDVPAPAVLGHEMIHAVHNADGNNLSSQPDPKDPTGNQEESQTVGINDHKDKPMTENNLLKDMGEDWQRTDHDGGAVRPDKKPKTP